MFRIFVIMLAKKPPIESKSLTVQCTGSGCPVSVTRGCKPPNIGALMIRTGFSYYDYSIRIPQTLF